MTDFIYDIEVLPNVFTCSAKNTKTGKRFRFEISKRRNDRDYFEAWLMKLAEGGHRMVGFNNVAYDYPVIHYLFHECGHLKKAKHITRELKAKSDAMFRDQSIESRKFVHSVWASDYLVAQIDLFKIHHMGNKARRTSLKRLQFNMRLANIVEFDLDFQAKLDATEIDGLMDYNDWDVDSTEKFYHFTQSQISFREEMSELYDQDFMNDDDTKLGEKFLTGKLRADIGTHVLKDENGKKRGTKRGIMPVSDFIFPYIEFEHPALKATFDRLMKLNVFVVKGKFHWNEHPEYPEKLPKLEKMAETLSNNKKHIKWMKDEIASMVKESVDVDSQCEILAQGELTYAKQKAKYDKLADKYCDHHITSDMDGFVFELGKGGLHGTRRNAVFKTTKKKEIEDIDAAAYYPSVAIANGLYPEHLTKKFVDVYGELPVMRAQHAKGTSLNTGIKLAANGAYGKSNSKYSVFFDPLFMITITLNGQLMLMMLWEQMAKVPGVEIIQANTDGITISRPTDKKTKKKLAKICKRWEKLTGIVLEYDIYSRMWVRDGNNYVAEYAKDGSLKAKGDYAYRNLLHSHDQDGSKLNEWHKNHSMLVVQKAVEAQLVQGIPAAKFIKNHKDIYDFFINSNVNRNTQLVAHDPLFEEDRELQRVSRFIAVRKSGRYLFKIMPPTPKQLEAGITDKRRISLLKEQQVQVYNEVKKKKVKHYPDIDYQFYINEANKLLEVFK